MSFLIRRVLHVLIVSFVFTQVIEAQIAKPKILKPASSENAATRTEILTVPRLALLPLSAEIGFPITTPAEPFVKKEIPLSEAFEEFKRNFDLKYLAEPEIVPTSSLPRISVNFALDANKGDFSAPLDNTIAVSNDGNVITVTNGIIEFYDLAGALTYRNTLSGFLANSIKGPCDPKVIFDPVEKKFIFFAQRCREQSVKSEILLAYSTTSDPGKPWNVYVLPGNPLNQTGHWFDYPKIGISREGIFLSGNVFDSSNKFVQTVVYQVERNAGYKGTPLRYLVWHNIVDQPFTLQPATYGFDDLNTDGIFLVGTTWRNGADYIKLYDITGGLSSSPSMKFYTVPTRPYFFFVGARQLGEKPIDNGDLRIQDAVLLDDKIVFVFSSGIEATRFSRVNLNVLHVPTLTNNSMLLGDNVNSSYAYPSVHVLSNKGEQDLLAVLFNASSRDSFPDIRLKTCDASLACSQELKLKNGESTIDGFDRWGDYSGIAKNKVKKSQLWLTSSYGKNNTRQSYISNIGLSDEQIPTLGKSIEIPVERLRFRVDAEIKLKVRVRRDGKEIASYDQTATVGENIFQVVTQNFPKGIYQIEIYSEAGKIVKFASFARQ